MVLEQHKPVCRLNCGRDSTDAVLANIDNIKTENEEVDLLAETKMNYKYSGDMYQSVNYNFNNSYSGGYYDTACFAV